MMWLVTLMRRWRRPEADFADEIRAHLALETDRLIDEGWDSTRAADEARRRFGNVTAAGERYHDARRFGWLDDAGRDLRFAARTLRKERMYAAMAIAALALGIGANAALFTLYDAVALRQLPVPQPDRMVDLYRLTPQVPFDGPFMYPEYAFVRDHARSFSGVATMTAAHLRLGGVDESLGGAPSGAATLFGLAGPQRLQGSAEPMLGLFVSANFFDVWRVRPILGHGFSVDDDRAVALPYPVLLSENFWRRRFASDSAILGTSLLVNGYPSRVVGITPRDFMGTRPQVPDVWLPLGAQTPERDRVAAVNAICCQVVARLATGATVERARAELTALATALHRANPALDPHAIFRAETSAPLGADVHSRLALVFFLFQPAVALILLIACANVAGLLLGRAASRQREIAIRLALGAGRGRLVRQLLTECILVAAAASVAGLLISTWVLGAAVRAIQSSLTSSGLGDGGSLVLRVSPDARIAVYTLGIALATGIVFGLAPALHMTRPDLQAALKDDLPFFGPRAKSRFRGWLVGTQIAVCLTLLLSAGLLVRASQRLVTTSPGFETKAVLRVTVEYPNGTTYTPDRVATLRRTLAERLPALPGVASVAVTSRVPLDGNVTMTSVASTDTRAAHDSAERARTLRYAYTLIGDRYFATLHIPLLRGRAFTSQEQATSAPVAIVSASLARRLWGIADPIGRRVTVGAPGEAHFAFQRQIYMPSSEVVGVAADVYSSSTVTRDPGALYLPFPPSEWTSEFLVRSERNVSSVTAALAAEFRALDPHLSVMYQTLEGVMATESTYLTTRILGMLFGAIGILGLGMACVGVYSAVGFAVSQQTREVGIRMALGAQANDVIRLVLGRSIAPLWIGLVVGLGIGTAIARAVSAMMQGLYLLEPATIALIAVTLSAVAVTAAYLPA